MANIKLNDKELNFLVSYLPAYGTLDSDNQKTYLRVMQLLAQISAVVETEKTFYFPRSLNMTSGWAVPVIKYIRIRTGWGLKEAKDAFDAEHKFSLSDFKMTREQLSADVVASTGYALHVKFL